MLRIRVVGGQSEYGVAEEKLRKHAKLRVRRCERLMKIRVYALAGPCFHKL